MKVILAPLPDKVLITYPAQSMMTALTNGGLGRLPGDAVTDDLPSESHRVEAATAMPFQRAVENLIRAGHDGDFARTWCRAVISGGETSATALDLVRRHAYPQGGTHYAADRDDISPYRMFRDAWRARADRIFVDIKAAKGLFARHLIGAKRRALDKMSDDIDTKKVEGECYDSLEVQYQQLVDIDLRQLGSKVMLAESVEQLMALWPCNLSWSAPV